MAGNSELQQKLREGIDAAKAGDAAKARRLLSEVVRADGQNELAWIWLATVLGNPSERRLALKRVLDINPNNNRAREALRQLEEAGEQNTQPAEPALAARISASARPAVTTSRPLPGDEPDDTPRQGIPPVFFLFGGLVLFLLVAVSLVLLGSDDGSANNEAMTQTALAVVVVPSDTPTPENTPLPTATNTPIPANLITRLAPTLPPTLTLTPSATPTLTPQLTPTFALSRFDLIYISQDPSQPQPDAFVINAAGENEGFFVAQMRDVKFAPDAFTLAFVRDIYNEAGELQAVEIFTTTLANPNEVVQVTTLGALDTADPVWSPDGEKLVFSSSGSGNNPDLWIVNAAGNAQARRLIESPQPERAPALSPDGTRLAFSRDEDLNGFTEIYIGTIDLAGGELLDISAATDTNGSSYDPVWSPDGRTIAFASDRSGDGDIYLMDSDGFNEQVVTVDGSSAEDRNPVFSPDGLWLAFISNAQDDRFQAYLITTRGTDLQRLTNNPRSDVSVVFKPLLP